MDDDVDQLYAEVKSHLTLISRKKLDQAESRRWTDIISLTINLEHTGDIIERIVSDLEEKKISQRPAFSKQSLGELNVATTCGVRSSYWRKKGRFCDLERAYSHKQLDRLAGQFMRSMETSALHLDLFGNMKRLNSLFCSTAYPALDAAGALHETRLRKRFLDTLHIKE